MKILKVLIACEESGTVRDAFTKLGHDATSCDLLPTRTPGKHYQGDVFDILYDDWDLVIAHPPCTCVCVSGNRSYAGTQARADGVAFIQKIWDSRATNLAIENPVGVLPTMSTLGKATQRIQPWMFGEEYQKTTCLWLKGLPPLVPTNIVGHGEMVTWKSGKSAPKWYADALKLPKAERQMVRSKTFPGIALAMATQWSAYCENG